MSPAFSMNGTRSSVLAGVRLALRLGSGKRLQLRTGRFDFANVRKRLQVHAKTPSAEDLRDQITVRQRRSIAEPEPGASFISGEQRLDGCDAPPDPMTAPCRPLLIVCIKVGS